jgi:type I restriction enzyme S subunit
VVLDDVTDRRSGHTPNKKISSYWDDGIKWVSLADSAKLDKVYISKTDKNISYEGIQNSSAVLLPAGTVVLSRDAGVGKSAIMTEDMAVSQHFIAWVCRNELDNLYLYYVLQFMKPVFERIAIGSTIKTIGLPFFKKIKVSLPPFVEQKLIARNLYSQDQMMDKLHNQLIGLNRLKSVVSNDLLSGKVRVV